MPSFTTQISDLRDLGPIISVQIAVDAATEESFRKNGRNIPSAVSVTAMVDIGASQSVLREDLVQRLNLEPLSAVLVATSTSTDVQCYEYPVRIILPNNLIFECEAIAAPLQGQHIQC